MQVVERVDPEVRVLTGTMPTYGQLLGSDGSTDSFDFISRRAMWSWLRLHMGKKNADETIKALRERLLEARSSGRVDPLEYDGLLDQRLKTLMMENNSEREIQYILKSDEVLAVATTDHLLIPPSEVIARAQKIIEGSRYHADMGGLHVDIQEIEGLKIGFNIDPGDIVTRKAIRVGFGIRVISCFNPLTFLNTGSFKRFFGPTFEGRARKRSRVLRYKQRVELDDRIREAYERSISEVEGLRDDIDRAKGTTLDKEQTRILGATFPLAFNTGESVVKQIWKRLEEEDETIWGLAMAASYVARHGKHKKHSPNIRPNLAGAAAGYLFIREVDPVVERCKTWLKDVRKIDLSKWM